MGIQISMGIGRPVFVPGFSAIVMARAADGKSATLQVMKTMTAHPIARTDNGTLATFEVR